MAQRNSMRIALVLGFAGIAVLTAVRLLSPQRYTDPQYQTRKSNFDYTPPAGTTVMAEQSDTGLRDSGDFAERKLNYSFDAGAYTSGNIWLGAEYGRVEILPSSRYAIEVSVGAGGFCVNYLGAYPVYRIDAGERSEVDWKGQIAFDGRTVRASEQTRFYPVALNAATGSSLDAVSYRLDVTCSGCKAIFVNGSAPKAGPQATFSSDTPRQLMLYAGDFPYTSAGGVHFVGASITPADADAIRSGIKTVADAHATYLGVPYSDEPVYLTFAAVSRSRMLGQTTWLFVTWPTIAMDGRVSFSQLLRETEGRRVFVPDRFIAHEMAHYYFGARYAPRGPLQWFLLESTAEFLALKAHRASAGEEAYAGVVRAYFKEAVAAGAVIPLDNVREPEQIGRNYRYRLGPLLLIALEQYAGEGVVRKTLASLVTEPPVGEVSYAEFRERLLAAGATVTALTAFEAECLRSPVASGCLAALPQVK